MRVSEQRMGVIYLNGPEQYGLSSLTMMILWLVGGKKKIEGLHLVEC